MEGIGWEFIIGREKREGVYCTCVYIYHTHTHTLSLSLSLLPSHNSSYLKALKTPFRLSVCLSVRPCVFPFPTLFLSLLFPSIPEYDLKEGGYTWTHTHKHE